MNPATWDCGVGGGCRDSQPAGERTRRRLKMTFAASAREQQIVAPSQTRGPATQPAKGRPRRATPLTNLGYAQVPRAKGAGLSTICGRRCRLRQQCLPPSIPPRGRNGKYRWLSGQPRVPRGIAQGSSQSRVLLSGRSFRGAERRTIVPVRRRAVISGNAGRCAVGRRWDPP